MERRQDQVSRGVPSSSSVTQQPETGQPASQERRGRLGSAGSRRSGRRLPAGCFHRGAVVQLAADEAPAASDVVDAAGGREARLLLGDGADPFVAQVALQVVSTCSGDDGQETLIGFCLRRNRRHR